MNAKFLRRLVLATVCLFVLGLGLLAQPQGWKSEISASARIFDSTHNVLGKTPDKPAQRAAAGKVAGKALLNLPLSFEANRGQFGAGVEFGVQAAGGTVALTGGELAVTLRGGKAGRLRMRLLGAQTAQAEGVDPLGGRVNYLLGDDSRRWLTDLPTFGRVRYRAVYPGIDLIYYGNGRQLEYDWVVAPGADVAQIKVAFDGADHLRLNEGGDLILRTAGGEVRQQRPFAYQERAGQRQPVACQYVIGKNQQVGLKAGTYDPAQPLIIDPTLVFATYFGGAGDGNEAGVNPGLEDSFSIAVDASGDIYIAGSTRSRTLPIRNALQPEPGAPDDCRGNRCVDVFIAKLNPNGLIYSTYIGGGSDEEAYALAVDSAGNAYVTGYTNSARFPVTAGAPQTLNRGYADAFVLKLAPSGSALVYGTYLGGAQRDYGYSLAVDQAGSVYVTGETRSPDFPLANAFQARLGGVGGASDAFVTKLDPTGTALIYSTYFGGGGSDGGNSIALDETGHVHLTGATASYDFPTRRALHPDYLPGYDSDLGGALPDIFVSKFDPAGRELIFSTFIGSYGFDVGTSIALDRAGNIHVAGYAGPGALDTDFPFVNPLPLAYRMRPHPFPRTGVVMKFDSSGSQLLYSTFLGSTRLVDLINDIAVDGAGRIYVTGLTFWREDFPVTADALSTKPGDHLDAFLSVLDPARPGMEALVYSTLYGGVGADAGNALALDAAGNIYLTGTTTLYAQTGRTNDLPMVNPLQSYGPASDAFIAKFSPAFNNAADPVAPVVAITQPTTAREFATGEASLEFAGTASDNVGVTQVVWTSDRVGFGHAQGTNNWSIRQLPLLQGLNRITVTARDAVGNAASATVEINVQPQHVVSTVAGGWVDISLNSDIGDGGLAVNAILRDPSNVLADSAGNLYIADNGNARIRKVTAAGIIQTFAGGQPGFGGDGGPATSAQVDGLGGMALDAQGNFYFTDAWNHRVRKVSPNGVISTVAGSGNPSPAQGQSSGDGGPATQARLNHPTDVALDAAGNLYINDSQGFRIRKVDASGIITTIAGTGVEGNTGDGGAATEARISGARSLSVDSAGNLYFISGGIRRISPSGIISTLPDTTHNPPSAVRALALDGAGGICFNETNRVRLRDAAGNFKTLAGNGEEGPLGESGAALAARFNGLGGITLDGQGNIYVVDSHRVRKLSPAMTGDNSAPIVAISAPATGNDFDSDLPFVTLGGTAADDQGVFGITWRNNRGGSGAVAGTNTWQAFNLPLKPGSNEITISAQDAEGNIGTATLTVNYRADGTPPELAITSPTDKNLFETTNGQLTLSGAVSDNTGVAEVYWRNDRGQSGYADISGQTWRVTEVLLQAGSNQITVTAADFAGNRAQARLEIVCRPEYLIETYAGRGDLLDVNPASDAALQTRLGFLRGLAFDAAGNLYIAENQPGVVRKITPGGTVKLAAGSGDYGDGGDGGPAVEAQLRTPDGLAFDAAGNLYIADSSSFKIRKVTTDGRMMTIAGTGQFGDGGDGGPATAARFRNLRGLAVDGAGNLYLADQTSHRVRRISADGIINTIAGNGTPGFSGDGGPAANAQLNQPTDLALDAAGNLFIADSSNARLRKLSPSGVITTVAGNGTPGFAGDNGPAISAQLGAVSGIALDAAGNILLADPSYNRIRKISTIGIITTIAGYDEVGLNIGGFVGDGGPSTLAKLNKPSDVIVDRSGNIFVADEFNFRIRKLTPFAPNAQPVASVSAASFSGAELAAEAIAAAFGTKLATAVEVATSTPLPAQLAGTTVKVRDSSGAERLAPLFFVSPEQVNYLVPKGTAPGLATVTVSAGNGAISSGVVSVGSVAPGLFTANANGQGVAAAVVLRIKADGAQNYEPVAVYDPARNRFIAQPIDFGPPGDQVFLLLFGTGMRGHSSLAAVNAVIGNENAEVLFAGAQGGFAGLDQINVRLPRSLAGRGDVDVSLSLDGKMANIVRITVR